MDRPKPICLLNFFEVGGIKISLNYHQISSNTHLISSAGFFLFALNLLSASFSLGMQYNQFLVAIFFLFSLFCLLVAICDPVHGMLTIHYLC